MIDFRDSRRLERVQLPSDFHFGIFALLHWSRSIHFDNLPLSLLSCRASRCSTSCPQARVRADQDAQLLQRPKKIKTQIWLAATALGRDEATIEARMRKGEVEVEDEDSLVHAFFKTCLLQAAQIWKEERDEIQNTVHKEDKDASARPSELSLQLENRATLRLIEYFRDKRGSQKSDRRINRPESALHQLLLLLDSQRSKLSLYLLLFVFDRSEKLPC